MKHLTINVSVDEGVLKQAINEQIRLFVDTELIEWLGNKADECGNMLEVLQDEYCAEYGWYEGYM